MTMMLTWSNNTGGGVPPGPYHAEFAGVETLENDMGKALVWKWRVMNGVHEGKTIKRITGNRPTPNNACGKILSALLGKSLSEGEQIDLATLVGKRYLAIVAAAGDKGGTRVETVTTLPD